jgi:hypothetical protein
MFNVRPVCADDEAALAQFFKNVTLDDIRFRFLTGIQDVGHDRLFGKRCLATALRLLG